MIRETFYLADPAGVELLPGAAAGLRQLAAAGAVFAIVSNQSGVGRGYFTTADVEAVNAEMARQLRDAGVSISQVYYCPHAPDSDCACRKPSPSLLQQAAADSGLALDQAFCIGDKASDVEAGRAAGCRTVLVLTGYGEEHRDRGVTADFVARDLAEAADWILRLRQSAKHE